MSNFLKHTYEFFTIFVIGFVIFTLMFLIFEMRFPENETKHLDLITDAQIMSKIDKEVACLEEFEPLPQPSDTKFVKPILQKCKLSLMEYEDYYGEIVLSYLIDEDL